MLLSYMYLRYVLKGAEKIGIRLVIGGGMRGGGGGGGLKKIQHNTSGAAENRTPICGICAGAAPPAQVKFCFWSRRFIILIL